MTGLVSGRATGMEEPGGERASRTAKGQKRARHSRHGGSHQGRGAAGIFCGGAMHTTRDAGHNAGRLDAWSKPTDGNYRAEGQRGQALQKKNGPAEKSGSQGRGTANQASRKCRVLGKRVRERRVRAHVEVKDSMPSACVVRYPCRSSGKRQHGDSVVTATGKTASGVLVSIDRGQLFVRRA